MVEVTSSFPAAAGCKGYTSPRGLKQITFITWKTTSNKFQMIPRPDRLIHRPSLVEIVSAASWHPASIPAPRWNTLRRCLVSD